MIYYRPPDESKVKRVRDNRMKLGIHSSSDEEEVIGQQSVNPMNVSYYFFRVSLQRRVQENSKVLEMYCPPQEIQLSILLKSLDNNYIYCIKQAHEKFLHYIMKLIF